MATAPANNLPLFYKDLVPLSSIDHADYHARSLDTAADTLAPPIAREPLAVALAWPKLVTDRFGSSRAALNWVRGAIATTTP